MGINRNNYEKYFLDFLEGNLDSSTENEFRLFLENNPDLEGDLDLLRSTFLKPDKDLHFSQQENLKKEYIPVGDITPATLDEYLAARKEQDLSAKHSDHLEMFLELNPQYKAEWERMALVHLKPDTEITYPDKTSLKKGRIALIPFQMRLISAVAAAALLVILLGIRFLFNVPATGERENAFINPLASLTNVDGLTSFYSETLAYPGRLNGRQSATDIFIFDPHANLHISPLPKVTNTSIVLTPKEDNIYENAVADLAPFSNLPELQDPDPNEKRSLFGRVLNRALSPIAEIFNAGADKNKESAPVNIWTFADLGIKGYNLMADKELELITKTDSEGKVSEYTLVEDDQTILYRNRASSE